MGQYYKVVNLDKKEYLHPHRLGDGLKLMEFGADGEGTMLALALLLAQGNGQGSGDFVGKDPNNLVGSWAGNRIVIVGDYCETGEFANLYGVLSDEDSGYTDISGAIRAVMITDGSVEVRKDFGT